MKVAIIGGGNIGVLMSAEMSLLGNQVSVFTSKSELWHNNVDIYDVNNQFINTARIYKFTNCLEEAIADTDIIFVTTPSFTFENIALKLESIIKKQIVVVVPGTGAAEWAFKRIIDKGNTFIGLQRVHSIARVKELGKSVYMLGKKDNLFAGVINNPGENVVKNILEELFEIPTVVLSNYLNVTFTPSNPILHTTRLYSMFNQFPKEYKYNRNPYFYREWDDESSKYVFEADKELLALWDKIPFDISQIKSLGEHYESDSEEKLTKKIQSIKAFKDLKSPMIEKEGYYYVDWQSRYFTADFSFGLKVILEIAKIFNHNMPTLEKIWLWYKEISETKNYFEIDFTKDDFINMYRQ